MIRATSATLVIPTAYRSYDHEISNSDIADIQLAVNITVPTKPPLPMTKVNQNNSEHTIGPERDTMGIWNCQQSKKQFEEILLQNRPEKCDLEPNNIPRNHDKMLMVYLVAAITVFFGLIFLVLLNNETI